MSIKNLSSCTRLLQEILAIPSPTFKEQQLVAFLKNFAQENLPPHEVVESYDSFILKFKETPGQPHICLVGHSDVVPESFPVRFEGDRMHGAGTSDMLGAVACYFDLLSHHGEEICDRLNISILIYAREEGTPLPDNGLYDLIRVFPDFFKTVDLAVVGEPTDNTVQLGCCGSLHLKVVVEGQACHSARPWNGSNALYKAAPFINAMAEREHKKHQIFGCDFLDVLSITESHCQSGRTSLPGWWEANVNFRYAPVRSADEAEAEAIGFIEDLNVEGLSVTLKDNAPSGAVIETPLFSRAVELLNCPIEAKQAWTDVAQLSELKVPCFNFGPGLTAQAHQKDEYLSLRLLDEYCATLKNLLLTL